MYEKQFPCYKTLCAPALIKFSPVMVSNGEQTCLIPYFSFLFILESVSQQLHQNRANRADVSKVLHVSAKRPGTEQKMSKAIK